MAGHWLEMGFGAAVLGMLLFETLRFRGKPQTLSLREALLWSLAWLTLAALFGLGVYLRHGPEKGLEFAVGYVIEWSLSLDNLFVFALIFSIFAVPEAARQRALLWGIVGAVILRGVFIAAGAALLARFEWILYLFGAFLVITGAKLLVQPDAHIAPDRNPVLRLFRRFVAVSPEYHGPQFFVRHGGRRLATPLVPVLLVVGTTDLLFATDSIPAIFGITRDPFIVYSSNVFAVLGLRGLFFLLSGMLRTFRYLKPALAAILIFVGGKMLLADFYPLPAGASLAVVGAILAVSIAASLLHQARSARRTRATSAGHEGGSSREAQPERGKKPLGRTVRRLLGLSLLAAGVLGLLLPVVPGIPLLLAGVALAGSDHPWVRPVLRRLRGWRTSQGRFR